MLGIHNRAHLAEFEEHLSQHILNRTGSENWNEVKHVLVIGSKYPWMEGVLLAKGVEKITSLVSNPELTRSEHPNITIVSYSDLSKKWEEGSVTKFKMLNYYAIRDILRCGLKNETFILTQKN